MLGNGQNIEKILKNYKIQYIKFTILKNLLKGNLMSMLKGNYNLKKTLRKKN